jgi:hypothetical protein
MAYLASTPQGRRVYLNRLLTDADFVLPIGRLGYDPVLGYRGPWGAIFPGLSDAETREDFRRRATDRRPSPERGWPTLTESADVSWLLGSQFHVGAMPGGEGLARVVAGLDSSVRAEGSRAVDAAWTFRAPERAELVVAGIGGPDRPTRLEDLVAGLTTAARLVRRGGRIVALSRAEGTMGPALRRLVEAGDERSAPGTLRGLEAAPDYFVARQLARALAWADIYLLSSLDESDVDDLSMIALGRPEEARKLIAASGSCLLVSQAERTRVEVADDEE